MINDLIDTLENAVTKAGIIGNLASFALERLSLKKDYLNSEGHFLTKSGAVERASKIFRDIEHGISLTSSERTVNHVQGHLLNSTTLNKSTQSKVALVIEHEDVRLIKYYSLDEINDSLLSDPLLTIAGNSQLLILIENNSNTETIIEAIQNASDIQYELKINSTIGIGSINGIRSLELASNSEGCQIALNGLREMSVFLSEITESLIKWNITTPPMSQSNKDFTINLLQIVGYCYWQYLNKVIDGFTDEDKKQLEKEITPQIFEQSKSKIDPIQQVEKFNDFLHSLYSKFLASKFLESADFSETEVEFINNQSPEQQTPAEIITPPFEKIIINLDDYNNLVTINKNETKNLHLLSYEDGEFSSISSIEKISPIDTSNEANVIIVNGDLSEEDVINLHTLAKSTNNSLYIYFTHKEDDNTLSGNFYEVSNSIESLVKALVKQKFSESDLKDSQFLIQNNAVDLELIHNGQSLSEISKGIIRDSNPVCIETLLILREYLDFPEFLKPFLRYAKIKNTTPNSVIGDNLKVLIEYPKEVKSRLTALSEKNSDLETAATLLFKGIDRLNAKKPGSKIPVKNNFKDLNDAVISVGDILGHFTNFKDETKILSKYLKDFKNNVLKEFKFQKESVIDFDKILKEKYLQEALSDQITGKFVEKVNSLISNLSKLRARGDVISDLVQELQEIINPFIALNTFDYLELEE